MQTIAFFEAKAVALQSENRIQIGATRLQFIFDHLQTFYFINNT